MSASTPAPAASNVERLTKEQLDALPMGAVVRFLDDPGRRHVVAFKSGERVRGVDYTRWLLSDGGVFLSAVALADAGAVLHDPAPPVVDETTPAAVSTAALAAELVRRVGEACPCRRWSTYMGAYDADGYTVRCHGCLRAIARCTCG